MKLHLGKRLLRQVEKQEAWWAENRLAAPDLFAREFRDTLELIRTTPGAGVSWPTDRRPTLRRVLMPKTKNHIYFRVDAKRKIAHIMGVWGKLPEARSEAVGLTTTPPTDTIQRSQRSRPRVIDVLDGTGATSKPATPCSGHARRDLSVVWSSVTLPAKLEVSCCRSRPR